MVPLTKEEQTRADAILAKGTPEYRKAYSDRMAWLLAYLAELAYLKFDERRMDEDAVDIALERALKIWRRKGSSNRIIGIVRKFYEYDHKKEKCNLERSLEQVELTLVKTLSTKGTQAYLASNDEFTFLAFRGAESDRMKYIRSDAKATQKTCPTGGRVHSGFMQKYDDIYLDLEAALDQEAVKGKPLFITGHSVGGAVATIAARRLDAERRVAACYTYGSPRVGAEDWVAQIKTPIYRIVNSADPVPTVPFSGTVVFWMAKALRATGRTLPLGRLLLSLGNWMERTMSGYAHAGSMRFLTDCKDGNLSNVDLLYSVGWGRRFRSALTRATPAGKVLSDHGISLYRRKLMVVAERRNK